MFDHYTQSELSFKLNCHIDTLRSLAKIGPGFRFITVQRGTRTGYVIRKDEFYAWMCKVSEDKELHAQVIKHAPSLNFISVSTDRNRWLRNREELKRVQKTYQRRPYGRGLENENKAKCSGTGGAL